MVIYLSCKNRAKHTIIDLFQWPTIKLQRNSIIVFHFTGVINLKPNVFMASIDSKYTCFSLPINLEHQKYLKCYFLANCINFKFTCMSNVYGLMVDNHKAPFSNKIITLAMSWLPSRHSEFWVTHRSQL